MGTEYYLADYTDKKLICLHKISPDSIENVEDDHEFNAYWYSLAIVYIFRNPEHTYSILNEYGIEYEKLRFEDGWGVIEVKDV